MLVVHLDHNVLPGSEERQCQQHKTVRRLKQQEPRPGPAHSPNEAMLYSSTGARRTQLRTHRWGHFASSRS